ncbi:MAG TPA: Crp/Fnr family transcriptional regulator [Methylomirabilota bacterium]|nr:Crp/Fnr family transcriptional regulator [Methylomirabilota bacterium]
MHSLGALTRKLSTYAPLSQNDIKSLISIMGRPQVLPARHELRFDGEDGHRAFLIEEGWAFTYKILANGSRQVVDIGVAGDILGMRGLLLRNSDLSGALVTPAVVCELTTSALYQAFETAPRVAAALLWSTCRDESLIVEHLVDVGRRSAIERVAHFMLELYYRLRLVGLCQDGVFKCPLSQSLIADALGLTPIHLNRTMRELRENGLVVCSQGIARIEDERRLCEIAGYDPTYLDQARPLSA